MAWIAITKLGLIAILIGGIYTLAKTFPIELAIFLSIALILLIGYWILNLEDEK